MEPIAKTDAEGRTRSLVGHSLDVANAARLLATSGVLKERVERLAGTQITAVQADRLAVLAGFHDFGKALVGFQERISGKTPSVSSGHVAEALAAFASTDVQTALEPLFRWFDPDVIYSTICHHGEPVPQERYESLVAVIHTLVTDETTRALHELAAALLERFPEATKTGPSLSEPPELQHLWAGIVMAADWMGSGLPLEGDRNRPSTLAQVVNETGWSGWHSGREAVGLLKDWEPHGAQRSMLDLSVEEQLAVIEAPTGSGKTEAALIWASRLVEAGKTDGLYFAVPSRSAATELHDRVARTMANVHPALRGKVVRAVPGMLDTDQRPDYEPTQWAVAAPKRVFAAPVAVGTIDQAMLSHLRVRHAWLRAACLSRHLLVVDEVHASDPYMAAIIEALVRRHLDLGGYVLAMSATLGESALARLQGRPRMSVDKAMSAPYPAVRTGAASIPVDQPASRTTRFEMLGLVEAERRAVQEARCGGCVLMIRSTVADAVAAYNRLATHDVRVLLHHSRFALPDRTYLDETLQGILGRDGTRIPIVVVATQTAEQSLDIDADLLVTDACPADVLLQRLGRLHRHRVGTSPTTIMIDPGDLNTYLSSKGQPLGQANQGWPWVYKNLLSVHETIRWLRQHGQVTVPDDSRTLVERTTHFEHLEHVASELGGAWPRLWQQLTGQSTAERQLGEAALIDWSRPYAEALCDDWHATRLGEGTVDVDVDGELRSTFTGERVEVLPVPGRWLKGEAENERAKVVTRQQISVGTVRLRYDELGLRRDS